MTFVRELKRRNVFRVAIAYLALAWLLTEVAGTLFPAFGIPDWGVRFVVAVLALGFVPALVFSWIYELTPEGIKREQDVVRDASITHLTARRLDLFTIAFIAVALGFILADRLWLTPKFDERSPPTAATPNESAQEEETAEPESRYPSNSIAVLPFVNMSEDSNNEYFADGISEELLNLLAKIPELRVTSRSSSFYFKGKDARITDVARELKVAHVLEGSVRKAGDQVRITTQLIETSTDTHLWSETYDRTLDDIFAVQNDIAASVVGALKLNLLGELPRADAVDSEVYTLFLRAQRLAIDLTEDALEQSNALLRQALDKDPNYTSAWRLLARNYAVQAERGYLPGVEGQRLAQEAIDRALAIDPDLAEAHSWLAARSAYQIGNDLGAAAQRLQHALSLEPANYNVLSHAAAFMSTLGRLEEAIAIREYLVAVDPLNPIVRSNLGWDYLSAERIEDALATVRSLRVLSPKFHWVNSLEGMALLANGQAEAALDSILREPLELERLTYSAVLYFSLGRTAESDAALRELTEKHSHQHPYAIAAVLAYRNEADRAFDWMEEASQRKDSWLWSVITDPLVANVKGDPRWSPFLQGIGRSPEQLAEIEFEVKLPH